ncbi:MAG: hypothetical protein J6U40_09130 [Kiritimatiellae bacterium]|nr:hypothetical protein [Kiritimatiellia bacterium]
MALESGIRGDGNQWWVRVGRDACFGPVPLATLQDWARDGRIDPASEVSSDYQRWSPAIALSALEMEWIASLPDGRFYGPIHRDALNELLANGGLPADTMVFRRSSPTEDADLSRESLLEQIRQWTDAHAVLREQIERERREATADLVQSQRTCQSAQARCAELEEVVARLQADESISQTKIDQLQTLLEEAQRETAALAERCETLRRTAEAAEEKYRQKCEEASQTVLTYEMNDTLPQASASVPAQKPAAEQNVSIIEPEVIRPETDQPIAQQDASSRGGSSALEALERQLQWELSQLGDNAPKIFDGKEPAFLKAFAFLKRPSFLKLPAFLKRG